MSGPAIAAANFAQFLRQNPYPGRGFVIARSAVETAWLIVYWIMGRSARSQNRRFVVEGSTLRTEPVDAGALDNPGLIIYEAMLELPGRYLVGNGDQVRALHAALQSGENFDAALATWGHEPDAPHYTPRISALLDLQHPPGSLTLSVLKANAATSDATDRWTYRPALPPAGLGVGLTTYRGDGNPLPSFSGEPLLLPCPGRANAVLEMYWEALDVNNRLAIAVKHIPADGSASTIITHNRFAR
jgi:IMP cyclohydrolase